MSELQGKNQVRRSRDLLSQCVNLISSVHFLLTSQDHIPALFQHFTQTQTRALLSVMNFYSKIF